MCRGRKVKWAVEKNWLDCVVAHNTRTALAAEVTSADISFGKSIKLYLS